MVSRVKRSAVVGWVVVSMSASLHPRCDRVYWRGNIKIPVDSPCRTIASGMPRHPHARTAVPGARAAYPTAGTRDQATPPLEEPSGGSVLKMMVVGDDGFEPPTYRL